MWINIALKLCNILANILPPDPNQKSDYTFDEQNDEMSKFEKQMWNFRPLNMIIFKNLYQLYKYNKHTIISIIFNFI